MKLVWKYAGHLFLNELLFDFVALVGKDRGLSLDWVWNGSIMAVE